MNQRMSVQEKGVRLEQDKLVFTSGASMMLSDIKSINRFEKENEMDYLFGLFWVFAILAAIISLGCLIGNSGENIGLGVVTGCISVFLFIVGLNKKPKKAFTWYAEISSKSGLIRHVPIGSQEEMDKFISIINAKVGIQTDFEKPQQTNQNIALIQKQPNDIAVAYSPHAEMQKCVNGPTISYDLANNQPMENSISKASSIQNFEALLNQQTAHPPLSVVKNALNRISSHAISARCPSCGDIISQLGCRNCGKNDSLSLVTNEVNPRESQVECSCGFAFNRVACGCGTTVFAVSFFPVNQQTMDRLFEEAMNVQHADSKKFLKIMNYLKNWNYRNEEFNQAQVLADKIGKKESISNVFGIIVACIILFPIGMGILKKISDGLTKAKEFGAAINVAKDSLRDPASAEFENVEIIDSKEIPGKTAYFATMSIRAKNAFNATTQGNYCLIFYHFKKDDSVKYIRGKYMKECSAEPSEEEIQAMKVLNDW